MQSFSQTSTYWAYLGHVFFPLTLTWQIIQAFRNVIKQKKKRNYIFICDIVKIVKERKKGENVCIE